LRRHGNSEPAAELFGSLTQFFGFYLAGGTALALQIRHRLSVDFDLFSPDEIDRSLFQRIRRVFPDAGISPLINNPDELTVLVNNVKITFLKYPFPPDEPFVVYENVPLLSVRDIAVTKAYTIGRRGSYKDYVDLYFIVAERHATLTDIIHGAEQRYGADFNSRLFLEQLVYLDDVEDTEIKFLKSPISPAPLRSFFEVRIRESMTSL
jgi:hypothetical protein